MTTHPPTLLRSTLRGMTSFPRPRLRNRPRASSSRRGTTTLPPTHSSSAVRGMTIFPSPRWTQSPPREIRPPWDDYPPAHPLKIHLPRDDQLPPGRADAIAPARAPAAVGRLPFRPPSRDPPSAGWPANPLEIHPSEGTTIFPLRPARVRKRCWSPPL